MDQFGEQVAEGVRAQAMHSYLTTRMDKDSELRLSFQRLPLSGALNKETTPTNQMSAVTVQHRPGYKKIKDPAIMQQILDRERDRIQGKVQIATSYALNIPPVSDLNSGPAYNLPISKTNPQVSYTFSAKDKSDFSISKHMDASVNPGGPLSGFVTKDRMGYASNYGYRPEKLPYEDEVDILAENKDRYHELSHWHSTLEKPSEENLEVLKKVNHDRLAMLQSKFKQSKEETEELNRIRYGATFDADFIRNSVVESQKRKSSLSASKRAQFGKDFEEYLKRKRNDEARSRGDFNLMVEFDRYECTSPNPKRVAKDYSLLFRENV